MSFNEPRQDMYPMSRPTFSSSAAFSTQTLPHLPTFPSATASSSLGQLGDPFDEHGGRRPPQILASHPYDIEEQNSPSLLAQQLPAMPSFLGANEDDGGRNTGSHGMDFGPYPPDLAYPAYLPRPGSQRYSHSAASTTVPSPHLSPHMTGADPHGFRTRVRRTQTVRRVELVQGNLVLECPVPTKLLQAVPLREGQEFTHMRYSAATTDPNGFVAGGYTLRPALYGRKTELFVIITMYNEDDILFTRTMHGVMKNVAHLCDRLKSKTWGKDGWQKVVVCVVADGRKKCHPRVLTVLQTMGVYQEGIAKNSVNGKDVTAHIFEYTTQVSVDPKLTILGAEAGFVPVQVLFCLKEQNKKKLNSHRWFFNAFAPILNPNVCVLLDAGTRPSSTSIYHLWKAFDRNSNIAGACGEICAMLGPKNSYLLNPLVAAQNFEYKMSNILDKPLESLFGYISVLPGAFSAYRYVALKDSRPGVGPLSSYFKGENQYGAASSGIFEANMYLAEDRILCFELFAKPDCSWSLHYVKSAKAETDVPDNVPELISQRRRWLNGSFFAALFAITHANKVWGTNHSIFRKFAFMIENLYMIVNLYFSWFALGNFYITFYYLGTAFSQLLRISNREDSFLAIASDTIFTIFQQLYIFITIVMFICSMGNRPQGSTGFYTFSMVLFGIIMAFMLLCAGVLTKFSTENTLSQLGIQDFNTANALALAKDDNFQKVVLSVLSTYGLYLISSLLHAEPWHMIHSLIQYMFVLPSYINILNTYAFCNVHDVSWGTKGDNTANNDLGAVVAKAGVGGTQVVDVEVPTEQVDINRCYDLALRELKTSPEHVDQSRDAKTKKDDYYRGFRTRMVLAWMISNGSLVGILTSERYLSWMTQGSVYFNPYLSFIFWSVASLAAIRFVGSVLYLVVRVFFG